MINLPNRISVHYKLPYMNKWSRICFTDDWQHNWTHLRWYEEATLAVRSNSSPKNRWDCQAWSRFYLRRFGHRQRCSSCNPKLSLLYVESSLDYIFSDGAIDVHLTCVLVSNMIEHKELLFVISFHDKFIMIAGEVHALGVRWIRVVGFEANHDLNMLLSICSAAAFFHVESQAVRLIL